MGMKEAICNGSNKKKKDKVTLFKVKRLI
jgi:hypothetical protein